MAVESPLVNELLALRQKLADAGLWATCKAMDDVVKAIGFEIAEKQTARDAARRRSGRDVPPAP